MRGDPNHDGPGLVRARRREVQARVPETLDELLEVDAVITEQKRRRDGEGGRQIEEHW